MLTLGADPDRMTVHLTRGADFRPKLESYAGDTPTDYPAGTTIRLDVENDSGSTVLATWTATVTGNVAQFAVDKAAINTLLAQPGPKRARLYFVNGTDDDLWAYGPVREH